MFDMCDSALAEDREIEAILSEAEEFIQLAKNPEKEDGFDSKVGGEDKIVPMFNSETGPNLRAAENILRAGIGEHPESVRMHQRLFVVLRDQGRVDEGLDVLRRFADNNSGRFEAKMCLFNGLVDSKQYPEEMRALARDLVKSPQGKLQQEYIASAVSHVIGDGKLFEKRVLGGGSLGSFEESFDGLDV